MKRNILILKELTHHAPFTAFGAATGALLILLFYNIPSEISYNVFYVLHPIHVLLSALATASMYKLYSKKPKIWIMILIGYLGSIGIATLSDSIIPYLGEFLLNLPNTGIHLGFIEEWWLVNPLAFLGMAIAYYYRAETKFPHAGHVLLSTWASLFHIIMALGGMINWILVIVITVFLFLAVWLPCCLSDIIFPLLFVKNEKEI
jgi:hypothetical protein